MHFLIQRDLSRDGQNAHFWSISCASCTCALIMRMMHKFQIYENVWIDKWLRNILIEIKKFILYVNLSCSISCASCTACVYVLHGITCMMPITNCKYAVFMVTFSGIFSACFFALEGYTKNKLHIFCTKTLLGLSIFTWLYDINKKICHCTILRSVMYK